MEAKWQALIIVSIGIFISTLDGSILNIANPIIAKALQVSLKQVQWVVTAYMLIITVSLLFFGKLGDRVGGSRVYTGGFLVFSLGSAFCSVSPTLAILVTARILQGIGASMMMATGVGIVANAFPAGERGKALGLTGSVVGLGNMAGPGLGGILMANFAWPVVFLINIPIGLTGFILGCKYLPRNQVKEKFKGNDGGGFFLFALASAAMLLSISAFEKHQGWILLLALLLLAGFYVYEKKAPFPLLDLSLFKIKAFLYGNLLALLFNTIQMPVYFLLPFYLENLLKLSPMAAGLLMTITPVTMALTAPLAGNLSDRIGSSKIVAAAFIILTMAFIILASLGNQTNLLKIGFGLGLMGIGMGMFSSPNSSSVLASIPRDKAGYGGGFMATIRNFAYASGTAGSAAIFTSFLSHGQARHGYVWSYVHASNTVYWLAAAITCLGFLLALTAQPRGDSQTIHDSSPK